MHQRRLSKNVPIELPKPARHNILAGIQIDLLPMAYPQHTGSDRELIDYIEFFSVEVI
jgi:hypothetical protein